jgi:hypothetical protein
MKLSVALLLLLLFGTTLASETSFGTGEAKDCSLARALAIKDALEKYSEHEFDLTKKQTCKETNAQGVNCTFSKQLSTEVAGTLKRVISEKEKHKRDDVCVVEVKIEIESARTYFGNITGDVRVFAGDVFDFKITTFERLYVYVFNIFNRSEIVLLYPTTNNHMNLVNGIMKFPSNLEFRTHLDYNVEISKESLMVVFTKHKLTFKNQLTSKDIYDTIANIPVHSRQIVYHNFEIIRR